MTSRPLGNGIDFGTSNSAVAIAYADRVEVVTLGSSSVGPALGLEALPNWLFNELRFAPLGLKVTLRPAPAGGMTGPDTLLGKR